MDPSQIFNYRAKIKKNACFKKHENCKKYNNIHVIWDKTAIFGIDHDFYIFLIKCGSIANSFSF